MQNIWVRKVNGTENEYVVIEGNRRITAIKNLIKSGFNNLTNEVKDTLNPIQCKDLSAHSDEEIQILLGFKHIMSGTLNWKIFPTAKLIISEYVKILFKKNKINKPEDKEWIKVDSISKELAEQYSIKPADLNRLCYSYKIYLQLKEASPMQCGVNFDPEENFGKIWEGLTRCTNLKSRYNFSTKTGEISENGVEEFLDLIIGEVGKNNPIIKGTASGKASIRDFEWVLKNDVSSDQKYISRIVDDREPPSKIKAKLEQLLDDEQMSIKLQDMLDQLNELSSGELKEIGGKDEILLQEMIKHCENMLDWKR